eukprot:TRINITY_DN3702_c0_g1_i1.p1 TRINITY_DN3702_c0_g1~~TRINITY_DN3702_c0_g1_i1.p1  ORF type:complete len:351 (+),score=100.85 TRINITY_DN3702_c0_g1_i1:708-1760(+)
MNVPWQHTQWNVPIMTKETSLEEDSFDSTLPRSASRQRQTAEPNVNLVVDFIQLQQKIPFALRMQYAMGLLVLCLVEFAHGWGADGHRAVAAIASKFLDSASRIALHEILKGRSLESVANWADEIKGTHAYSWSSSLHYINTRDFECGFKRSKDCPHNWCLASAIDNYTNLIASAKTSDEEMEEAVKFLVHFMGDLSQPLHVGFGSDEGGNLLHGRFQGRQENLHSIWDSVMIEERIAKDFAGDYAAFSRYLVARVMVGGDLFRDDSVLFACTFDCVDEWASESAANNCKFVYTDDKGHKIKHGFDLGDAYFLKAVNHIERLLIEGGIRLAHVLNRAIAPHAIKQTTVST